MNATTSGGTSASPLRERLDVAGLDDLDDLLLDRLADPLQLLRAAVERELGDRRRRSPASASRRGGRRARGTTRRPRARAGRRAGRTGRRRRRSAGSAATETDDTYLPYLGLVPDATICLPTYNERENLEPMLRALAPLGVHVLVIDDNSPDGTGEIADRLAQELDFVSVLHRDAEGGPRPRLHRRVPPRARGRRRATSSRWTATSRTTRRTSPRLVAGLRRRRRPRARARATSRAAAPRTGAAGGASSRPAARGTRATLLGVGIRDLTGGFKCYRRARARDASTSTRSARRATRSRSRRRTARSAPGFARRRGADPLRRPHRGHLEDEPRDRPRGGRAGAGATVRGVERGRI